MSELDRRRFLTLAAGVCAACAVGDVALSADSATKPAGVDIGTLADYKADGISDRFARQHGIMVVRNNGRIYVMSNRCTHKGSPINARGDGFVCPKHDSRFSIEGTVTKGQASSTLPRYAITVNEQGRLMVDLGTSFREKQFEDEKAFVAVK